jgi:hypothetical protein
MTPFLLTLLFGGLDFDALFNNSQAIAASTRNGAEYARTGMNATRRPAAIPAADGGRSASDESRQRRRRSGMAACHPTSPVLGRGGKAAEGRFC